MLRLLFSPHSSLNFEAAIKPFSDSYLKSNSYKYAYLSPEYRYWFKRPLYSHYLGDNIMGAYFDVTHKAERYHSRGVAL